MTVHTHRDGPVLVVTIDRPEVRNAVDGPTAAALSEAFREFDTDDSASVAVLTGSHGTFCAGADLKAIADRRGNRVETDITKDGPLGPTRMLLSKPVIAAVEGHAVAGGLELAATRDLGRQLGVNLRVLHLKDVELYLLAGELFKVAADTVSLGATTTDDDTRTCGVDIDTNTIAGALDLNLGDTCSLHALGHQATDLDIFLDIVAVALTRLC